ncbi:hypothetical protein AWM70_04880 [Paenibacillus yonginensis]|uniref:Flagellar hook-length control protein-like C-terminal domain-containing protein n=1 Tax=Paenibacillus yonginensis TaxID=1462996 RepID=A0A1B1MXU0_9BACL|nr:hypothetical protein [Paenibacillus yonginensis]ANS73986.1 hypothetical protein AWM70_04880 [Paenibacillus yonginensis]
MNIGPIVKGVLGKSQPSEAKTLELRTGQVVRGTVLSVSDDGTEAVVEVQGVRLKAALETPLQQGQSMMMQVQPPGQDGLTVFKPLLSGTAAPGQDGNMEQLLKLAGLSDSGDNRELVRLMQQAGLPITREQVEALVRTLSARPDAVPLPEWVNAAAVAVQRGLPLSGEVVAGLRQAIFGPPAHQLLAALEEQLASLLDSQPVKEGGQTAQGAGVKAEDAAASSLRPSAVQTEGTKAASAVPAAGQGEAMPESGPAGGASAGTARAGVDALLNKLQSVLSELRSELAAGKGDVRPDQAGVARGAAAVAGTAAGGTAAPGEAAQAGAQPAPGGAAATGSAHGTESWVARVLKLLGAEHEQQAGRALLQQAAPKAAAAESAPPGGAPSLRSADGGRAAAGGEAAPAAAGTAPPAAGSGAQSPGAAVPAPGAPALAPATAGQGGPSPAAAGAGDPAGAPEAAPANPPAAQSPTAGRSEPAPGTAPSPAEPAGSRTAPAPAPLHVAGDIPAGASGLGSGSPNASGSPAQTPAQGDSSVLALKDNLKSILLQIIDTPDAPPQLQEAAKQMVQQLTGQQLLLNTDRTAPFAQVTMFLPFEGPDGGETATIQIQSRRGKKGELDPDNCRLWFDLNMSALGKLMVDVQVADKKVILQIHSEGEAVGAFLEGRQEEIGTAIQEAGYRLVALRTASYVTEEDKPENPVSQTGAASYAPPVYRGVDYRI